MNSLSCSSLPLISICAQAQHAPETRIIGDDSAARLGTAVHTMMAELIGGCAPDLGASAHDDIDGEELATLYHRARKLWLSVASLFPGANTEVEMASVGVLSLTGHCDVLAIVDGEVRIADHKTGYLDSDASAQLRGYGWLALQRYTDLDQVYAVVLRVRYGERMAYRWTRSDLDYWLGNLLSHLTVDDYRPGPHCRYCQRWHECPAGALYSRQCVERVMELARHDSSALSADDAVTAITLVRVVERAIEMVRDHVRTMVVRSGGRLENSAGDALVITSLLQREIMYAQGAAILDDVFGDRLPEVIKVRKTDVERLVKESAPRGMKGAAVQGLMDRLAQAGAIKTNSVERLEVKTWKQVS